MALSFEIWNDFDIRLKNLRGDMLGQWAGDPNNEPISHSVQFLSTTIQSWQAVRPLPVTASMVDGSAASVVKSE